MFLPTFAGFQSQRSVAAQGDAQARHQPVVVLFGIIEGRVGSLRVVAKLCIGATAGQAQLLVFAAGGEIGLDAVLLITHIGKSAVVAHLVIVPVTVAVQGAHGHGAAQATLVAGGVAAAAQGAVAAAVDFQSGTVFIAAAGNDIDHPAYGTIAIQRSASAGENLDTFDGGQGKAAE